MRRKIKEEAGFEFGVSVYLWLAILVTLLPIWYVLMISLTPLKVSPSLIIAPWDWTIEAYRQLTNSPRFLRATINTILITVLGVFISLIATVLTAYPLSKPKLPGRNFFVFLALFVFLFNAGLIPSFLLVKDLGMLNTWWSLILPVAISVYNLFVVKAFFQNLPPSLIEAAQIDGASEMQILWRVVLPLSTPILMTVGLFYAVGYWNEFFTAILYMSDKDLMPLSVFLRDVLSGAENAEFSEGNFYSTTSQEGFKMAAVVLTMVPMLLVYPWIQRYFTKGVLLGGVKE